MMDVYCPKCGEPWEMDSIHDQAAAEYGIPYYVVNPSTTATQRHPNPEYDSDAYQVVYKRIRAAFQREGCSALGSHCSEPSQSTDSTFGLTRQEAAGALYELLGDDMDGAAATLGDMGW